jgi:hypothetical protein
MSIRAMKLALNSISIIDVESNLQSLEEAVSGHFEAINLKDGGVMLVNRKGMLKQYPHNDLASYISERHIYGTALIVGMDFAGHFCDVPEQYFTWLEN